MEDEAPKETTRKVIMKLTLVNNRTDKLYTFYSENEFGLMWNYVENPRNGNLELLNIDQLHQTDSRNKTAVGRFTDFSILECKYETFNIV